MDDEKTSLTQLIPGAGYIRYSSNMQDDSFSLEAQIRQIKARAANDGVEIVKFYADPALSAYTKKFRPGVLELLTDSQKNFFDVVYVHKVDRLARRLEWAIEIVQELEKSDVRLKAVEQNFDLDKPEGKLMFHLLGSLGEFYSDNLSQETHKGKHERFMQGLYNGIAPYGYQSELVDGRKIAVHDPIAGPLVMEAFERYATGLYYDQQIADWFNQQGVKTKRDRPFTKDTVRDMLQNPFHKGLVVYTGAYAKGKTRSSKEKIIIQGLHTPLVSDDLFEKCQEIRKKRNRNKNTRQVTSRVYLLAGLMACTHCQKKMRAQSAQSGRYYREASRFSGIPCKYSGKSIRADAVEAQVIALIEQIQLPENWQASLQDMLKNKPDQIDPQKEKSQIKAELRRMREGYKRGLYEDDPHTFWREVESLQARLESLEKITPNEIREAAQKLLGLQDAWNIATLEEKQELIQIIFKRIDYDFSLSRIVQITPNPEYEELFQIIPSLSLPEFG